MEDELKLLGGAMVTLALATAALVIVPFLQLKAVAAPAGLKPYSAAQLRGRNVYIQNGCIYCHSQQPRDKAQAPDDQRGWGHLAHLFQPRAYTQASIMPAYPFLFDLKSAAEPGDRVVHMPDGFTPAGKVIVAKAEVLDLVIYLQGLDHTYPVREAPRPVGADNDNNGNNVNNGTNK